MRKNTNLDVRNYLNAISKKHFGKTYHALGYKHQKLVRVKGVKLLNVRKRK